MIRNLNIRYAVNSNQGLFYARHLLNVHKALHRGDRSWSENGEDDYAGELAEATGWYVDVGSQNPVKHSNTYRLYRRGWRGIAVEPNRALCRIHRVVRPKDIVFNGAIGPENGELPFYEMSPQNLSTFSPEARDEYVQRGDRLVRTVTRRVSRLSALLDKIALPGQFGLLSVDVEGWDRTVLSSNDWERWRPTMVIAEQNSEAAASGIADFFGEVDYRLLKVYANKNALYKDARS